MDHKQDCTSIPPPLYLITSQKGSLCSSHIQQSSSRKYSIKIIRESCQMKAYKPLLNDQKVKATLEIKVLPLVQREIPHF